MELLADQVNSILINSR